MTTPRSGRPDSGAVPAIPMVAEPDVDRSASLGNLVKEASTQVSTLVRAEIELAKLEVTKSLKRAPSAAASSPQQRPPRCSRCSSSGS